jgi:hypothetical protein
VVAPVTGACLGLAVSAQSGPAPADGETEVLLGWFRTESKQIVAQALHVTSTTVDSHLDSHLDQARSRQQTRVCTSALWATQSTTGSSQLRNSRESDAPVGDRLWVKQGVVLQLTRVAMWICSLGSE